MVLISLAILPTPTTTQATVTTDLCWGPLGAAVGLILLVVAVVGVVVTMMSG